METLNQPEQEAKPEFVIENDQQAGIDFFINDLFERVGGNYFNMILECHRELRQLADKNELTPETAREYLERAHETKSEQIENMINESREMWEKEGAECLSTLADYMDYTWRETDKYKAIPVLLPYCPFAGHTFYLSLDMMEEKEDILRHTIHEISHFMLFQLGKDNDIEELDFSNREFRALRHLFKEALTGMLLSEPKLGELLKRPNYRGNREVHHAYIQEGSSEPKLFREYLREKFHKNMEAGKHFNDFLNDMITLLSPKAEEFSKRMEIYNQNDLSENPDLLKIYSEPIKV